MNAQKTMDYLYNIAKHLPEDAKNNYNLCMKHPDDARKIADYTDDLGALVAVFMLDLTAESIADSAKKCGKLDRLKAAQRIIKNAKTQPREGLHGSWKNASGMQCICDMYHAARLSDALDLESIPENAEPIDVDRIFEFTTKNKTPLNLPDVPTLKTFIKSEKSRLKAENKKPIPAYDFGDGLPLVDAQFLLDLLELLPDATATGNGERGNIYFSSAVGDGLLCPISKAARR